MFAGTKNKADLACNVGLPSWDQEGLVVECVSSLSGTLEGHNVLYTTSWQMHKNNMQKTACVVRSVNPLYIWDAATDLSKLAEIENITFTVNQGVETSRWTSEAHLDHNTNVYDKSKEKL